MNTINVKRLGLAFGATGALLYFGCAMLMFIVGHDGTVMFFNFLLHGIDVSSIVRMDIPPVEELIGLVLTFILAGLTGVCVAVFYNLSLKK